MYVNETQSASSDMHASQQTFSNSAYSYVAHFPHPRLGRIDPLALHKFEHWMSRYPGRIADVITDAQAPRSIQVAAQQVLWAKGAFQRSHVELHTAALAQPQNNPEGWKFVSSHPEPLFKPRKSAGRAPEGFNIFGYKPLPGSF